MTADRTFLMGKFPAHLPGGLRYGRNHMWAAPTGEQWRFGFSAYAIRLMQDVYFLDWQVNAGDEVRLLQQVGHIETSKAVSDLFAPAAGTLLEFNRCLLDDPSAINVDGYGDGWLFAMRTDGQSLLSVDEYYDHLAANWDNTQRLIKGKINTEE